MRGGRGKLGGGATIDYKNNGAQAASMGFASHRGGVGGALDNVTFPWLLSLTKTSALLAGQLGAVLVVGDCGLSPFLEPLFRSPAYAGWMKSDLFSGGCDPSYKSLLLSPLSIVSEDESDPFGEDLAPPGILSQSESRVGVMPNRGIISSSAERADFLEEVAGGYGRGGQFAVWLYNTYASTDTAYRVIQRQAARGRDGEALASVERAMIAALLRHGCLDGDAAALSAHLDVHLGSGVVRKDRPGKPPRRFEVLWKSVAEVRETQSSLKTIIAQQSSGPEKRARGEVTTIENGVVMCKDSHDFVRLSRIGRGSIHSVTQLIHVAFNAVTTTALCTTITCPSGRWLAGYGTPEVRSGQRTRSKLKSTPCLEKPPIVASCCFCSSQWEASLRFQTYKEDLSPVQGHLSS